MTRLAPHYVDEPPNEEPPHGYCPRCEYALVDPNECRCGWFEPQEARDDAMDPACAEGRTR